MPPRTQMQMALGTGGVGAAGTRQAAYQPPPPASSLAQAQDGFNAQFGGMQPQQMIDARAQGNAPLTTGAQRLQMALGAAPGQKGAKPAGDVGANSRSFFGMSSTPQEAGNIESMVPGAHGGSPEPGIPREEAGLPPGGPPSESPAPVTAPPPAQPPAPPPPPPAAPHGAYKVAAGTGAAADTGAGTNNWNQSGMLWNGTQLVKTDANRPANWSQMTAAQKNAWWRQHTVQAAAPGGGTDPATGQPAVDPTTDPTKTGGQGQGTTTNQGQTTTPLGPSTTDDGSGSGSVVTGGGLGNGDPVVTEEPKAGSNNNTGVGADWLKNATNEAIDLLFESSSSGGAKWWDRNLWMALSGTENVSNLPKLPHPNTANSYTMYLDDSDFSQQVAYDDKSGISEPGIRRLYEKAKEYSYLASRLAGDPASGAAYAKAQQKLYVAQKALEQYGIFYRPSGASQTDQTGHAPGDIGDRGAYETSTSLDLPAARWAKGTPLGNLLNVGGKELEAVDRLAIAEFLQQQAIGEEQLVNRQQAINEAVRLGQLNADDPLVKQFLAQSQEDLPTTDWEGVANRTASDRGTETNRIQASLGQMAGRRGLTAGTVAGLGTQVASEQQASLQRDLGEIDERKAKEAQALFQTKLGNLQTGSAVSTGLRDLTSQQIQQLLTNTPITTDNSPYQGLGNVGAGVLGAQWGKDAQDAAEDNAADQTELAKWQAGISLLAGFM